MKSSIVILLVVILCGCNVMKKMQDGIYIQQQTPLYVSPVDVDSLLIIGNGNSPTQRILEEYFSLFQQELEEKGVRSNRVFVAYSTERINEISFDKQNYKYTLWVYEQDRASQRLEDYTYLVPLAMKLTDNRSDKNIWIATSVVNTIIRRPYYREKYAGTLFMLFRANGFVN